MRWMWLLLALPACDVTPYDPPENPVLPPTACFGNNDGEIARDEMQFPLGVEVRYLVADGTVPVAPAGYDDRGTTVWDLRGAAGSTVKLTLASPSGWSAPMFAEAAYVTTTDIPSGLMGAFSATGEALLAYG